MLNQFSRTQLLLGKEGMDRLLCFGAGPPRPAACL